MIELINREVAKLFSVDGERDENQETGEQEFLPHRLMTIQPSPQLGRASSTVC